MAVTLDDIKKMSPLQRLLAVIGIYLLCGYFFYFYFLQADLEKRGNLKIKLEELELQVSTKERLAAELGKYLKGVDTLQEAFKTALTKLPVREEIPELLRNVALSGQSAGLSFLLFEPQPSVRKQIGGAQTPAAPQPPDQQAAAGKGPPAPPPEGEYYEEIPVKVMATGSYYNTAAFFAKLAGLPRIINVEDIAMGDAKMVNGKPLLKISCLIKTYMFVQKAGEAGKKTDEKKP